MLSKPIPNVNTTLSQIQQKLDLTHHSFPIAKLSLNSTQLNLNLI